MVGTTAPRSPEDHGDGHERAGDGGRGRGRERGIPHGTAVRAGGRCTPRCGTAGRQGLPAGRVLGRRVERVARSALAAVPVEVRVLSGRTVPVLLEQSRRADLLVVRNRGHGEAVSMLLGSVGLTCVLHATCPVTVVRRPARERAAERSAAVGHPVADAAAAPMY